MERKLVAWSMSRYNGGVKAKRAYGSSTITRFAVFYAEHEHNPEKWVEVEVGGKTPGERKSAALKLARTLLEAKGF